jgi:16S rRNA C1402 N4-methylase RsmH
LTQLANLVSWSHFFARQILNPGDKAIDLTAGRGRDALVLSEAVGKHGQVVSFDIQESALTETENLLVTNKKNVKFWPKGKEIPEKQGIYLVHSCHSLLNTMIRFPVKVVMSNLGYLPGGSHEIKTQAETTLSTLEQSLTLLSSKGRLVVVAYPSHHGGAVEAKSVEDFFKTLEKGVWQTMQLRILNSLDAPILFVAERVV